MSAEAPAVAALGPLFKITQVFLSSPFSIEGSSLGDAASTRNDAFKSEHISFSTAMDANSSIKHPINDFSSVEDMELAQQMDALGLPTSFSTTSEKRDVATRGRKKGTRTKSLPADIDIENRMPGIFGVGDWKDVTSSVVFHDSTNLPACCKFGGQNAASYHDAEEEDNRGTIQSDGELIGVPTADFTGCGNKQISDELTEFSVNSYVDKVIIQDGHDLETNGEFLDPGSVEDASSGLYQESGFSSKQEVDNYLEVSSKSCHITGAKSDGDEIKTFQSCVSSVNSSEFGDWRVFWDAFYMTNYFYNIQTLESTWYPPPGFEHLGSSCGTSSSIVFTDEAKEVDGIGFAFDAVSGRVAHSLQEKIDPSHDNAYIITNIASQEKPFRMNHATDISMSVIDHANGTSVSEIDGLAENCVSEQLYEHSKGKDSNEGISPSSSEVEGHPIGEMGGRGYLDKQEASAPCPESGNISDVSLDILVDNNLARTLNEVDGDENRRSGLPETNMTSTVDELVNHNEITHVEKKKRVRRLQSQFNSGVNGSLSINILKYWCQRYILFSRFDNGIKMDEEGWFSVTPEPIARHHASRCGSGTVIDCFTGVGGNAIQFALRSNHVIAVDIDQQRIDYAQHNAAIYGVNDMIEFIKGDFFQMAPRLKGDTVFMSPPWGGPDYAKVQTYDIMSMLKPHDGLYLFKIARMIAPKVIMFLPRNIDANQLAELSLSVDPPWALEVEKNFLNGKLKAITAYFSSANSVEFGSQHQ